MRVLRLSIPLFSIVLSLVAIEAAVGQSTNQTFPTPITSNEISGTIKARDIGDARLTSYYFQFDGEQGDLFINVVARNFTGDIDVFTQNGLRPLSKIVVYADFGESETGRVIYLRKPEKMILRVQGRTPGDDPATFRIKFAGSFLASTQSEPGAEPTLPTVTARNESGVRVNSVGTIVEIIPKATPTPERGETVLGTVDERGEVEQRTEDKSDVTARTDDDDVPKKPVDAPAKKLEVVVSENIPEKIERAPAGTPTRRRTRGRTPPGRTPPADNAAESNAKASPTSTDERQAAGDTSPAKDPDPLANVNLVILFKDGTRLERPMSEVLRFTVDKGVLTVTSKDGRIGRYSILDVAKVTIQ